MSLIRKGLVTTGGKAIAVALTMCNGMIVSRIIGPSGTGQSQLVTFFNQLIGVICGLGIGQACIYLINNQRLPIRSVTMHLLWIAGIWFPLYGLMNWLLILLIPDYFGNLPAWVTFATCAASSLTRMVNAISPILMAELRAFEASLAEIVQALTILVCTIALALTHCLTVNTATATPAISFLAGTIFLLWQIREHIDWSIGFDPAMAKTMLVLGLQLASMTIAINAHQAAPVLLLRKLGHGALEQGEFRSIGLFIRASGVCGMVSFVGVAAAPLLYSKWAGQLDSESRARQVELTTRLYALFGGVIASGAFLSAYYIMRILYGVKFVDAAPLLRVLVIATAFQLVANALLGLFPAIGRPLLGTAIFCVTLGVNVLINLLLIPRFDAMGASVAMLVAAVVFLAGVTWMACRVCQVRLANCFIPRRQDVRYVIAALSRQKRAERPSQS